MPSKPLFGMPVVVGMSEAVMATRSVPPPWAGRRGNHGEQDRRQGEEGGGQATRSHLVH